MIQTQDEVQERPLQMVSVKESNNEQANHQIEYTTETNTDEPEVTIHSQTRTSLPGNPYKTQSI